MLRKSNKDLTEEPDSVIKCEMPDFYKRNLSFRETTENESEDFQNFIKNMFQKLKKIIKIRKMGLTTERYCLYLTIKKYFRTSQILFS